MMRIGIEQQLKFNLIESNSGNDVFREPVESVPNGALWSDCRNAAEDFGTNV